MQTKREYAASLGLAQAGARGRLSREAHAAIEKAIAEGMQFSDANKITVSSKPATPKTIRVGKPANPESVGVAGDVISLYAADTKFTGRDSTGKKFTVDARQVCKKSGYSITSCPCGGPEHEVLVPSMEHIMVTPKGL